MVVNLDLIISCSSKLHNNNISVFRLYQCTKSEYLLFQVELRKTLDEVTQAQIVGGQENHFYHSYIFRSGVGNREGNQLIIKYWYHD